MRPLHSACYRNIDPLRDQKRGFSMSIPDTPSDHYISLLYISI